MPWIKISKEAHKDMKQFLVDIEGMSLGELVEALLTYAMQDVADFEKFLGLDESEEDEHEEEDNEDLDKEDESTEES